MDQRSGSFELVEVDSDYDESKDIDNQSLSSWTLKQMLSNMVLSCLELGGLTMNRLKR